MKLDRKINIFRLWLSTRKADTTEVAETDAIADGSRSFVIGWPPMNAVLTFATSNEKTLWAVKLEEYELLFREILRKAVKTFVVLSFLYVYLLCSNYIAMYFIIYVLYYYALLALLDT